jgi:predicted ATPase
VHRAARIAESGNGGQILLSGEIRAELPDDDKQATLGTVRFLGSHRFKDLPYPENVYEFQIPDLPGKFPPIKSIDILPTNLPQTTTAFVGREAEAAEVSKLLTNGSTRVVTLTGPGGAGKTRLSIEVAKYLINHFRDGVFQVQLGGINDSRLVCPAIAQVLRVPDYPARTIIEDLKHFISGRCMLLILDNFEQVIDAADDLAAIVDYCAQLRLLITSREPLHLNTEIEFPVSPMAVPEEADSEDEIAGFDSVKLFADRAVAIRKDFVLDERTTPFVARICRRLEGLPLAIELAASRLQILDVSELADRLDKSFSALGRGPRDVDVRHQTLRDAVMWSYNLLDPKEQAYFRHLGIFRGGFDLSGAEAICPIDQTDGTDILDVIASLTEKSLLTTRTTEGGSRFRMLEPIREFAYGQLEESGEVARFAGNHCDYFLALAESVAPQIVTAQQRRAVTAVLADMDNIRAALSWCLETQRIGQASRFLRALLWLWIPRGWFSEGRSWAERALAVADASESTAEAAVLHDVAGWLQMISGDYAGSLPRFEQSHRIFSALGDEKETARAMITLGITKAVSTGGAEGPDLIMAALERCRELDDRDGTSLALIALGEGARAGGDIDAAAECYREALALMRQSDNQYWIGALLLNLSHCMLKKGDLPATLGHLREVIDLATGYDYPMMTNLYVALMGELLGRDGDFANAARLLGAAASMVEAIGVQFEPADQAEFDAAIQAATDDLGDAPFKQAYDEGFNWSPAAAIAFARQYNEFHNKELAR